MSTLSLPSRLSTFAPESDPHFAAESALEELSSHVRALRLGRAPFDTLTPAERADQLAELLDTGDTVPVSRFVAVLSDDQLIALVADPSTPIIHVAAAATELRNRADAIPTPQERRRIETEDEDYWQQRQLEAEAESAVVTLDTPLHGRTFASFG